MKYNPEVHHRRSIRLRGYDYGQAGRLYCVTICTWQREPIFGNIQDGEMHLTRSGEIVRDEWFRTALLRPNVDLGEFVVMPNHIHGIIAMMNHDGRGTLLRAHPGQPTHNTPIYDLSIQDGDGPETLGGDAIWIEGTRRREHEGTRRREHEGTRRREHEHEGTRRRAPTEEKSVLGRVEAFGKPTPNTIPTIVRGYKAAVTKQINLLRSCPGCPVWQRNYYEHLIRDEDDYLRISAYILNNPRTWQEDSLNNAESRIKND
jgi:putative transposase